MICPYCHTDNRDDCESCYHCTRDLTMLRVIVNKAKHHYNQALEFAERDRTDDAIHELQNTLDLDGSMIDARVVLGTLYAKKEEFAKARDEWNAALALDHRLRKAHDYLNKAERAEVVFPVIRRLKSMNTWLIILAALIVAMWGATSYFRARPAEQIDQMSGTLDMIAKADLSSGASLQELRKADNNAALPFVSREAAANVARAIEQQQRAKLTEAHAALAEGAPLLALRMVSQINGAGDKTLSADIGQIRDQAEKQLLDRVDEAAKSAAAGTIEMDKLRQTADQAIQALDKDSPARKRIEAGLARAEVSRAQYILDQARGLAAGDQVQAIIPAMLKLRGKNPKLAAQIDEILGARLDSEVGHAAGDIQRLIGKGLLGDARAQVAEFMALYSSAGLKDADPRLAAFVSQISAAERRKAYAAAIAGYNAKKYEAFLAMSQDPDALTTDTVQRSTLAKMREEANRQFAGQMYDWMNGMDNRFETGAIDAQTAARVVENWQRVYDSGPKYGRAPVMFYAAVSHFKLGQTDRAKELIERVRKEYPKSFIQSEVRNFVKKYGKQIDVK